MDSDAKLDPPVRRDAGVALDHRVLHLDGATDGVDDAAKFDERAVTGSLHHSPVVHGDGRIDEVAAKCAQSCERTILVRAGEPAEANDVGGQNRREFSVFAHVGLPPGDLPRRQIGFTRVCPIGTQLLAAGNFVAGPVLWRNRRLQPKTAFSCFAPVLRVDLEGQQRVDSDPSPNGRTGRKGCLQEPPREGPGPRHSRLSICEREIGFTARSGPARLS